MGRDVRDMAAQNKKKKEQNKERETSFITRNLDTFFYFFLLDAMRVTYRFLSRIPAACFRGANPFFFHAVHCESARSE